MARILITDAEQRSSLAAMRSLSRSGHEVWGCSGERRPLAGASRHCRSCFPVPNPRDDPRGFIEALASIVTARHVEVVVPMTDVSIPLVLSLRETHPQLVIPFPELADYEAIADKENLMRVAAEMGVPVPRQVVLSEPGCGDGRVADLVREIGIPLVLKPARSAVSTPRGRVKFGVTTVTEADQLRSALGAYPHDAYPLLIQSRIVGPGLGVFVLTWGGRTIAAFAHKRIREKPPTGGVSVYRESVPVAAGLQQYSERLLTGFRWRGVAMVEFKQDAATGVPYLMEVNGRLWGSLQLAIDAGVDFPEMLIRISLGGDCEPLRGFREGVRSRWLWGDVDHLLWILRTPREIRSAHPELPGRLAALARFLTWKPGDRLEVLRWNDPRPFLRESAAWFVSLGS